MRTRLITLATCLLGSSLPAFGKTLIVDPAHGGYPTIQSAVDAAVAGDVVWIHPGTYAEEVVVPVSIRIVGSGLESTLVVPSTSRPGSGTGAQLDTTAWVFKVRASDVSFSDLTVDGNNPSLGGPIDARGGIVTDFNAGTFQHLACTRVQVVNVAYRGIYAVNGEGHALSQNVVAHVRGTPLDSAGIMLQDAIGEVTDNSVSDCSFGIAVQGAGSGGDLANNTITTADVGVTAILCGNPLGITRNTISSSQQGVQAAAIEATVELVGNQILTCLFGMSLYGTGKGTYLVRDNVMNAQHVPGSVGLYAATDTVYLGNGDVHVRATGNTFDSVAIGVLLGESASGNAPIMDVQLSGDPAFRNLFVDNDSFDLFLLNCNDDIDARGNDWGVISDPAIEQAIWHRVDDPGLGLVDFSGKVILHATVDDDGPADYSTINAAVQALTPGGSIDVKPGVYVEDVVIDRSLQINGSGHGTDPTRDTIIRGASVKPDLDVVLVTGSDVTLQKVHIDGTVPTYNRALWGVYATGVDAFVMQDCVVDSTVFGITYADSTNGLIVRNEITNFGDNGNGAGIDLSHGTATVGLYGNGNFCRDGAATGIVLVNQSSGMIESNRVYSCDAGALIYGSTDGVVMQRNVMALCNVGVQAFGNYGEVSFIETLILTCHNGYLLYGPGTAHYRLIDSHMDNNNTAEYCVFGSTASTLGESDLHLTVQGCVFSESNYGVYLQKPAGSNYRIDADLSGGIDANWITGNMIQDVYLDTDDDGVLAPDNYFGTADKSQVENKIHHKVDDPSLGLVDFSDLVSDSAQLRIRGEMKDGYRLALAIKGQALGIYIFFASPGTGSVPTPYGLFLLDPLDFLILRSGTIGPRGMMIFSGNVVSSLPPGTPFYFQGFVGTPNGGRLTNLVTAITPP